VRGFHNIVVLHEATCISHLVPLRIMLWLWLVSLMNVFSK